MKRDRATDLIDSVLDKAACDTWPTRLVMAIGVFGSYARGSANPGDVDLAVRMDRKDEDWVRHFVRCAFRGSDPYTDLRVALRGRKRAVEFLFEPDHPGYDDIPITWVWKRGEPISNAAARVRAIPVDESAGRAERHSMHEAFEGVDHWVPRLVREELVNLIDERAITVKQVRLEEGSIRDRHVRHQIDRRWSATSPLRRAAYASLAYLESRGIDLKSVHLHGADLEDAVTPVYVGFDLRYFHNALRCFEEDGGGVEWIEVVHATRRSPLTALQVKVSDQELLTRRTRSTSAYFG